jgi:inorganic pyrophosphatase
MSQALSAEVSCVMPSKTLLLFVLSCALATQPLAQPSNLLPEAARVTLGASLSAASRHPHHVWRDAPPVNDDGTVNSYVEIARDDRRKWEFDIGANVRRVDRVMPASVGGYPVNYGFVPQTVSYDGDPFDALVLGPPLPGGRVIRGLIVGLMLMEDEKGIDSKVVLSLAGDRGRPRHQLTEEDQRRIGDYFRTYKKHEPGKYSKVLGWGSPADGRAHVEMTHAFFLECRAPARQACQIVRPGVPQLPPTAAAASRR